MSSASRHRRTSISLAALRRLAETSVYEFSAIIAADGTITHACAGFLKTARRRGGSLKGQPCAIVLRQPDGKPLGRAFLRPRSPANPQRRNFSVLTSDGRNLPCRGLLYFLDGQGGGLGGALLLGQRDRGADAPAGGPIPLRDPSDPLLGSLGDGLCAVDARGRIVSASDRLAGLAGLHPADLVGTDPPYPWLGDRDNLRLSEALAGVVRTGRPGHVLVILEPEGDRPYALSVSITPLKHSDGLYLAAVRDISDVYPVRESQMAEQRIGRLKEQIHRNAVRLRILQEINASVLRSCSLDEICGRVTEGIGELVDHDLAGVYILEAGGRSLHPHTVSKITPFSRRLAKFPLTPGEGIIGGAAVGAETVVVNDAQNDPRSVYPPGMKPAIEHIIAAPVRGLQGIYGILTVARNRNPGFHEEDAQIVRSFADAASIALDHIRFVAGAERIPAAPGSGPETSPSPRAPKRRPARATGPEGS